MTNIVDERIKNLRKLMSEKGISFYIIPTSDPHGSEYIDEHYKCREYMSGFTGSAGTLVVSMNEAALFVDGRYHIQADKQTENTCISVHKLGIKGVKSPSDYIKDAINKSANRDEMKVAFDGRIMMLEQAKVFFKKIETQTDIEADLISELFENRPSVNCTEPFVLPVEISGEGSSAKIEKLRTVLKEKAADGIFLSALDDICYLLNIRGRDIAYSSVIYSYAYVTLDSATVYMHTDICSDDVMKSLESEGVFVADYKDVEAELYKIKGKTILIDDEYTSAYFTKILGLGNELIHVKNYDIIKKHVKNETEQNLARKYAVNDAVAMIEYISGLKREMASGQEFDEYSAGEYLDQIRAKQEGFFGLSFETICAYGENAAIVHYSASKSSAKKLERKGLLLVDSGSHYSGATTDITRTFSLGDITYEEKRAYTLVLKGNLRLMDAVFLKGTRCENLDILARGALWKEGLDYRHGTGHGIGAFLNVHEGPYRIGYRIREDMPQPEIEPGMIISDEPGYYEAGKFGIRHETQLLCVKKKETDYGEFYGFEPLSLVPFDKDAIDFSMLNEEEMEILKRYSDFVCKKVRKFLSKDAKKWLDYNTNYVDCNF